MTSPFRPNPTGMAIRGLAAIRFGACVLTFFVAVATSRGADALHLAWTNNLMTVTGPNLPGGRLEILYLEAFLRPGANQRPWGETKIPHRTQLLRSDAAGAALDFRTTVETNVEVLHQVRAGTDSLDLVFDFTNHGSSASDLQWFQPACVRTAAFTGRNQSNYTSRSFVFTSRGPSALNRLNRTTNALYLGGQVYLPPWTLPADANPRPLCRDILSNGLIGCFSADNQWILATASDRTHELFEGVYVCLHSDPLIAGLKPGETKRIRQKLYLLPNDMDRLLKRYRADFPESLTDRW
jgi:hypothetical protein